MAKDPAFLFYPGDWITGTMSMTFEEKGAYIELLMLQFNVGRFTEKQAKTVLRGHEILWNEIKNKFQTDGTFFWKQRLEDEQSKRSNYTKSRRANRTPHKTDHTSHRMENENENIVINDLDNRMNEFFQLILAYKQEYPEQMLIDFFEYWSEHNAGGKKMRYEKQPVFDLSRRLRTWARNNKNFNNGKKADKKSIGSRF